MSCLKICIGGHSSTNVFLFVLIQYHPNKGILTSKRLTASSHVATKLNFDRKNWFLCNDLVCFEEVAHFLFL
jgi:hypothetical protein